MYIPQVPFIVTEDGSGGWIIGAKLNLLYTNIGRGHPFYLDGIAEAIMRGKDSRVGIVSHDVFELSSGVSALGWRLVRYLYRRASAGGRFGGWYDRFREGTDYNRRTVALRLLGADLARRFAFDTEPLLVAHPSLVGMLAGRENLIYQHGELVVPREALVAGAATVLVPTDRVAEEFVNSGYSREQILVTGLCIEPALCEQATDAAAARFARIESAFDLTGLFLSSGAEPVHHVTAICESITSIQRTGGRAIIFAKEGGRLETRVLRELAQKKIPFHRFRALADLPEELPPLMLVVFSSRRQENDLVARLFSHGDYLVAPPHERTNWAVGLGLPMFALMPTIGTFAPLNMELLEASGTAIRLQSPNRTLTMGETVEGMQKSGQLLKMARAGWGKYDIRGFDNIARFLKQRHHW